MCIGKEERQTTVVVHLLSSGVSISLFAGLSHLLLCGETETCTVGAFFGSLDLADYLISTFNCFRSFFKSSSVY